MSDEQYKQPGFKDTFTRLFSILTLLIGLLIFSEIMGADLKGAKDMSLDLYMMLLGLHGIVTNPKKVNSVRRLLCNISLLSALIFLIYFFVLFFRSLGLVMPRS